MLLNAGLTLEEFRPEHAGELVRMWRESFDDLRYEWVR